MGIKLFLGCLPTDDILQVIDRELEKTLVIEDDVRFEHQFKKKLMKLMDDIDQVQLDWELM
jgi:collagen beta-1,O-galactosyltransferase